VDDSGGSCVDSSASIVFVVADVPVWINSQSFRLDCVAVEVPIVSEVAS
jgi:hypothetical protein